MLSQLTFPNSCAIILSNKRSKTHNTFYIKELIKMNDITDIVKILAKLTVEDEELFLAFIRRLACEETQDTTEPAVSSPPAELNISL